MENNDKLLAKIKKLLNLARKNTNSHEASLALERAQKMMREHRVTETDVALTEISEASSEGAPSNANKTPRYMSMLIEIIRQAFGVQSYLAWRISKRTVVFYGPDERPQVAAYAFDVLTRQMMSARREFSAGQRRSVKRTTKTGRADAFCEAWVHGAYQVIDAFAVTPAEKGLMEAYYKKISRNFVTVAHRPAKKVRGDEDARGAGYVAGTNARLSHGVDGNSSAEQEPLQIGR
ncbi:DUF7168 domain-containing protein [Serratia symbiotica]|uniref:DUF7168 domain-containing protein n=1 Tax=Serratia symbiotica TaxID=138074 RepID=UPI0013242A55|nr:DUF2786 domain-containing protein [Serratia symbiotica]QTP14193.1 DUF2786 domain-containing protein [Serratia symbiotica]